MTDRTRSRGASKMWGIRRARGGKYNEPPIRPDGTFAPHAVEEDPDTGCLNWRMSFIMNSRGGTPQASVGGRHVNVRRELWRIHREEPVPRQVTTSCLNPRCVNPAHLTAGTSSQIRQDRIMAAIRNGATREDVRKLGMSTQTERGYFRRSGMGLPLFPARPDWARARYDANRLAGSVRPPGITDRNWDIFLAVRTATLNEVGMAFGITRERVRQIASAVSAAIQANQEEQTRDSVSASVEMGEERRGGGGAGDEGDHEACGHKGSEARGDGARAHRQVAVHPHRAASPGRDSGDWPDKRVWSDDRGGKTP
jgi:hypothetical protein